MGPVIGSTSSNSSNLPFLEYYSLLTLPILYMLGWPYLADKDFKKLNYSDLGLV